jgi:hypothetical protein
MKKEGGIRWAVSLSKTVLINKIFIAHKKNKMAQGLRKLHNENLTYSSPNITGVINSRMRL